MTARNRNAESIIRRDDAGRFFNKIMHKRCDMEGPEVDLIIAVFGQAFTDKIRPFGKGTDCEGWGKYTHDARLFFVDGRCDFLAEMIGMDGYEVREIARIAEASIGRSYEGLAA